MQPDKTCVEDSCNATIEKKAFGRQRKIEETFGVYRRLAIAQTTNHEIAQVCQDGGAATALLFVAMEKGIIDAALITGTHPEKPFYPVLKMATKPAEILDAAGSKYTCSQNPITLAAEAKKQGKSKVAFVGMPCQILAFRRLQMVNPPRLDYVRYSLGLMCSGCFSYELITEFIQKKVGIDLRSIVKINIKQKLLITTNAGVTPIPLSEINQYKQKGCLYCRDFSSELADISVGGMGMDGWSFTVVRSEKGEELFVNAEKAGFLRTKPVDLNEGTLKLLIRLSQKKSRHE